MTSALPPGQQDAGAATTASTPATSPVGIPRIGLTPVLPKRPAPPAASTHRSSTLLVDAAPHRLRRIEDLLDVALGSVPSGGLVAYATCSPHRAETADVVAGVRDRVELLDAPALIPEIPGAAAATDPRFVQLWPHRHGTDAMFLALMRKR